MANWNSLKKAHAFVLPSAENKNNFMLSVRVNFGQYIKI